MNQHLSITIYTRAGGVANWIERLTRNWSVVNSNPSNAPVVTLWMTCYPHSLILVGSKNGVESDIYTRKK